MKLGFVTAIVPDLDLEAILKLAAETGYRAIEVQCWPPGKAERRYAGVTNINVETLDAAEIARIQSLIAHYGVSFSGLGYYPNALSSHPGESDLAVSHLRRVIDAAVLLNVGVVNSFIGRDPARSVEANWPEFLRVWPPLIRYAEERGIKIAIENCPMLFTADEWPGGKNLAISPAVWRKMFQDIPSAHFGLNLDPSHLIWQGIDYIAPIHEFKDKLFHIHAKDARLDRDKLNSHGVLSYPNLWHTPKIPGQGDVNWGAFITALAEVGYSGPVVVEVEDRAYEKTFESRKESLILSRRYLEQFILN